MTYVRLSSFPTVDLYRPTGASCAPCACAGRPLAVDPLGPVLWLATRVADALKSRRRVRVLVHRGVFLPGSSEHLFMKVVNGPSADVEITHIWFATQPPVHLLNPHRPLPARLRPSETFETWVAVAQVPKVEGLERLGRVLLSDGKSIHSRLNKTVPPVGFVAGSGGR